MKVEIWKHEVRSINVPHKGSVAALSIDPPITIFQLHIHTEKEDMEKLASPHGASWNETFGSEHELRLWMKGFEAGCAMAGDTFNVRWEIP